MQDDGSRLTVPCDSKSVCREFGRRFHLGEVREVVLIDPDERGAGLQDCIRRRSFLDRSHYVVCPTGLTCDLEPGWKIRLTTGSLEMSGRSLGVYDRNRW